MELNKKEQKKYEVIEKVVNGEITKKDAEEQLNLSRKKINRLILIFNAEGKEGFIHKNRGKINQNKKELNLIKEIEELYLTEYFDYNFEAFYEEIESKIELFKTRKLEQEKAYIRRSSNFLAFGQEIQMDACFKIWFGNISSALHLAVDKATKKVLVGWFEYEKMTRGYFVLLYHILVNYGIPYKIKHIIEVHFQ